MDDFLNTNKGKTESDAFNASSLQATQVFLRTLSDKLSEAMEDSQNETTIICLDKNHP